MSLRLDNTRNIRAPHGRTLTAKSWQTEAPMRMFTKTRFGPLV